jgi:hypothetical protein
MAPNQKIARPAGETPGRSASTASTGSQAATIHRAHIINVNIRDYTVDAQLESHPFSMHFDIPFMTPYLHQNQGEGINFMPEVGSICWVCSPSETGKGSFVLGWTPVHETGTFRAGRELLNPGDLHFSTRDGNFIYIRRGGVVQIGATPVCQRIYIPIRNIIRDFAENYELSTPAGDLTWKVNRTDEQSDGHRGCLYTLACKEFSDDPNTDPLAVLKIGSHGEGIDTILTLETRDQGGGTVKTRLEISKAGEVKWSIEKDLTLEVKGDFTTTVKGKMTTTSTGDMGLESKSKMTGKAPVIGLDGGGAKLDLAGTAALNGSAVNLGDALFKVVVDTPTLQAWINAVTAALLGPPSPPVPVFRCLIPPAQVYTSTKVKA